MRRAAAVGWLAFLPSALSCGGGSGAPTGQPGTAPTPPSVPTPPPAPPPPPLIGTPCPGVEVRGHSPDRSTSVTRATLIFEWEKGSGGGFDWSGPYYDDEDDPENRSLYPLLEVNVADWRIETTAATTRHTLEIEWPPFLDAGMIFRSDAGACALPALVCSGTGCELRR